MFAPCTAPLYGSTAATKRLKMSATLLSLSFGIRLISFPMMSSLMWIVFANFVFQVPPQKIARRTEILRIGWPGAIGLTRNESVPWEVMPDVSKCSIQEMGRHLIS